MVQPTLPALAGAPMSFLRPHGCCFYGNAALHSRAAAALHNSVAGRPHSRAELQHSRLCSPALQVVPPCIGINPNLEFNERHCVVLFGK